MGRPRKDSQTVDAKQRLVDSFWNLLEESRLHQITVGMIAKSAQCNRGTFYYHYADMDELVDCAVEQELLASDGMMTKVFGVAFKAEQSLSLAEAQECPRVHRIALLIKQGGYDLAYRSTKNFVMRLWEYVLDSDKALNPETRIIIEYAASGVFGLFVSGIERQERVPVSPAMHHFVLDNSRFLFNQICAAQNVNPRDATLRLQKAEVVIKAIQEDTLIK